MPGQIGIQGQKKMGSREEGRRADIPQDLDARTTSFQGSKVSKGQI